MHDPFEGLGFDAPSMWRWLHAQPPAPGGELGAPPARSERADFTLAANGDLGIALGPAGFVLRPVFPPAPWGTSTVRVGCELETPPDAGRALVALAARQLDTASPGFAPSPGASAPPAVAAQLSRWRAGAAPALVGRVTLFELTRPRVALWLDLAFVGEDVDGALGGGPGWLLFGGPRGQKSRESVVQLLAEGLGLAR